MRFEHAAMAWAFAAVVLPLLIHFLFKRRYETFTFGAMTVLRMALAKRKDRILLEQVLLIATRVLLLACLAAALLHPVIGQMAGETRPATCMVLIFDDSYSMLSGEGLSRFERAKFVGRNLMDSVEPQDEVYLLSATASGKNLKARPYRDADDAKAAIQALEVAWKPKNLSAAVRAAAGLFTQSKGERRELIVFTDRQKLGLGDAGDERWRAVSDELKKLDPRPRVFWVEPGLGEAWAERSENLVVETPRTSGAVVHTGEPLAFYVNVRNTGNTEVKRADVVMQVDGAPLASHVLTLPAKGAALARFSPAFEQEGAHRVSIKVQAGADLLAEDNTVLHAVQAERKLAVLLVDGNRTPEPLHNESDLARLALVPPVLGDRSNLPYEVEVCAPVELHRIQSLRRRFAAILFLNVREPDEALVNRLEQYVASGGGLLVALGDRCGREYYNRFLHREGRGLLPCEIQAKGGDEAVEDKFQVPRIVSQAHPALATLGRDEAGFENVRIRAWQRVKVPEILARTETILKLEPSGEPLLLSRPFGRGMLFILTVPLTTAWSDWPVHASFPLFVRGLVDSLRASQTMALNLKVGEPLEGRFDFEERGAEHTLSAPGRAPEKLPVRRRFGADLVRYEATGRPGTYLLRSEKEGRERSTFFAVNPDTQESDLTPATESERAALAGLLGAQRVSGWEELEGLFMRARRGLELWWLFLFLVAGLALLEITLARAFTRSFVDESKLGPDAGPGGWK